MRRRGSKTRRPRTAATLVLDVIGIFGELLITVAVVLGLFAFWQAFWTTYEVQDTLNQRAASFTVAHAPASTGAGTDLTTDPPDFSQSLSEGEDFAVIHVPSWNWLRAPIAEGTTLDVLNTGAAGHYPTTGKPGAIGNFAVAGHRRTYGEIFQRVEEFKAGDKVVVELADHYLTYSVASWEIVDAYDQTNVRVIAPVPGDATFTQVPKKRMMTMTTCHPDWGIAERYIIHLDWESWTPKSAGVPKALVGEPDLQVRAPEGQ
ncbi:class E sortase [Schaalia sp. 19OD2882]|uniref:class E sortase n=1 Tax=Schaalia sp. 19OD2882 TaxID=2794089 RepID=UPI0020A7B101|nr:class E sortase [Schaalia sp. 19OD2882]